MTTDNGLHADIHTLLGLIAGFRESGSNNELLDLLIEQLRIRQEELDSSLILPEIVRQPPKQAH